MRVKRPEGWVLWAGGVLLMASACDARGQQAQPEASSAATITAVDGQTGAGQKIAGRGGLSGVVKDIGETPVQYAVVTLTGPAGLTRTATTDDEGEYRFDGLPAGLFKIAVKAQGLADGLATVTLADGEQKTAPEFLLKVVANFQIDAVSQVELADEQIKQEETQRVFGIIPNFYVAFDPNTVAMNTTQKAKLAGRTLIDPVTFVAAGIGAGINQALQAPVDWGQDLPGYGQRYGAQMVGAAAGIGFSAFVFPTIFHQDPRYFYKGTGTVKQRTWWAVKQSVEQKGDNGKWQVGYSNMLGDLAASLATVAVYPHRDVNWGSTAGENFAIGIAGAAFGNLMEEFVVTKLTKRKKKQTTTTTSP